MNQVFSRKGYPRKCFNQVGREGVERAKFLVLVLKSERKCGRISFSRYESEKRIDSRMDGCVT